MNNSVELDEVCLVDDDPSVLRSMEYLLASEGLKVRAFNKPAEFLAHATTHPVGVVVTDIWMEGVTGLEILARMCALSPRPRVIVITAREDLAARATAMAIGPVAFFMKPFNDEKFLAAVRDALAARGLTQNRKNLKLPAHVLFRKDLMLLLWKPHGILDQPLVNEIVAFVEAAEDKITFNRFVDLSALDAVDLNFNFVFHVALHRRLSYAPNLPVKSAFYVTSPATTHYAKLHEMLTDHSPLNVDLFTDRAAAAKWLGVPVEALIV